MRDVMARQERLIRLLEETLQVFAKFSKPLPMLLSYKDSARELGMGLTKLKALVRDGKIIPSTAGNRKMIAATELHRFARPGPVAQRGRGGRRKAVPYDPATVAAELKALRRRKNKRP